MNKIRRVFNSYYIIEEMDLNWLDLLDKNLKKETKEYVENCNLDLHVLALLIKITMLKAGVNKDVIDGILRTNLNDCNLVASLMKNELININGANHIERHK